MFLVILKIQIDGSIEPSYRYHTEEYKAPHILDLLKEISRDNQGLKYDIVQITLIS